MQKGRTSDWILQYIKRYRDIASGNDTMSVLQDFMVELESPITGKTYGSKDENMEMMKEFCLHMHPNISMKL